MAPVVVPKGLAAVQAYVSGLQSYTEGYMKEDRGLDSSILRFFPVRVGKYGNTIFVHTGMDGAVCGYEVKNRAPAGSDRAFTGFSEGGDKGLFTGVITVQNPNRADFGKIDKIVICESAIDAISYAQHHIDDRYTMYASTGGASISPTQEALFVGLFQRFPNADILLAGDNDAAGEKHAAKIAILEGSDQVVERELPSHDFKGWNAQLLAERVAFP